MKFCKDVATGNLWKSHHLYRNSCITTRSQNWQDKQGLCWPKRSPLGKDNTSKDLTRTTVQR